MQMCILFESVKAPPEVLNEGRDCYGSPAGTATSHASGQATALPVFTPCEYAAQATSMNKPDQLHDMCTTVQYKYADY